MIANQPLGSKIMAVVPPKCLHVPAIKPYAGVTDLIDHLELFTSHIIVQDASDAMWCRVFSATLEGHACAWYSNLAHHSITNFAQVREIFCPLYAPSEYRRSTMAFVSFKQNQGKSLKDFVSRFNIEALSIKNIDQSVAIVAF